MRRGEGSRLKEDSRGSRYCVVEQKSGLRETQLKAVFKKERMICSTSQMKLSWEIFQTAKLINCF